MDTFLDMGGVEEFPEETDSLHECGAGGFQPRAHAPRYT
jgi:hypothetical protein